MVVEAGRLASRVESAKPEDADQNAEDPCEA